MDGEIGICGDVFRPYRFLVFRPDDAITVRALRDSRVLLGAIHGARHLWWNFVSSDLARSEQA
jgi:redox-sensitive bicupin YhaK (pirin superfamily)